MTGDEEEQAEFVAREIKRVVIYSKGLITFNDIVILMRANQTSFLFERVFRARKVPFTVVNFYLVYHQNVKN